MMIKRSTACRCVWTSSSVFKLNQTDLLCRVITGDETWIFEYDLEPKLSVEVSDVAEAEKSNSQNQKSKSCWSHSSMSEASSTVSSCHRARRSISKSTKRSFGICFVQCMRRDKSCGRTNCGCFTMTTHLRTTPWASGSSWPRRTLPYCGTTSLFSCLLHVTFSFRQAQGDH